MASVCNDPGGFKRVLFKGANGNRLPVRLGKVDDRTAGRICDRIEQLAMASRFDQPLDGETAARWVANVDDVSVGFSAAQDGSMKSPDPTMKTGGVRMKRADGDVLWTFATVGVKVVVVP